MLIVSNPRENLKIILYMNIKVMVGDFENVLSESTRSFLVLI